MTSAPAGSGYAFTCDACGEDLMPPKLGRGSAQLSWHECWERAKEMGWRYVKVKSKSGKEDGEHRCPGCA